MDCCREAGKVWRKDMKEWLNKELKVMVIDPYEKPVLHKDFSVIEDDKAFLARKKAIHEGDFKLAKTLTKEMTSFDLRCVDKADFLICYLDLSVTMCGTWDEVFHAADQRKPVLFMCRQGVKEMPPWLFGRFPVEFFFDSWVDLKAYLWYINGDKTVDTIGNRWKFWDYQKLMEQVL